MDKNKLTDSLTRFVIENRRCSGDDVMTSTEVYNQWIQRSGYVIDDVQTISWVLLKLKLLMKSNLQTMESIYRRGVYD